MAYYRARRADGWPALYALRNTRDHAWVRENVYDRDDAAPMDGRGVAMDWEPDWDYESDGDYDTDAERADIASGKLTPVVVVAYRPRVVLGTYGAYVDGWEDYPSDALGGVVVEDPYGWRDDPYMVDIVRDMASMAGMA
jgi:hypothetical protein